MVGRRLDAGGNVRISIAADVRSRSKRLWCSPHEEFGLDGGAEGAEARAGLRPRHRFPQALDYRVPMAVSQERAATVGEYVDSAPHADSYPPSRASTLRPQGEQNRSSRKFRRLDQRTPRRLATN